MDKPNVLFIYPDQLRYDFLNRNDIKTPNMNKLAAESVCFDNAFVSLPICSPFRASIMTGKYAHACGMPVNNLLIPLNQRFLPEFLNEAGYSTNWVGKWHLNGGQKYEYVPEEYRLGFQHFIGFTDGHRYLEPVYYRDNDPTPRTKKMYEPDMQTIHLTECIDDAIRQDRPFFAGICYGLPHPPLRAAPAAFQNLYRPREMAIPDTVPEYLRKKASQFMAKYAGLISNVDGQIGKILAHLEYNDILDDTMIIFCSDHGEMGGEHGQFHKATFYRSGMQVPFLIRYPKRFPAARISDIVDPSVDIMPTILDVCGIPLPDFLQGQSLITMMEKGSDPNHRDFVYYQLIMRGKGPGRILYPQRGIRDKNFVYVETCEVPFALYDLNVDPAEKFNFIGNLRYSETIDAYRKKLYDYMRETGDDWSYENSKHPGNCEPDKKTASSSKPNHCMNAP